VSKRGSARGDNTDVIAKATRRAVARMTRRRRLVRDDDKRIKVSKAKLHAANGGMLLRRMAHRAEFSRGFLNHCRDRTVKQITGRPAKREVAMFAKILVPIDMTESEMTEKSVRMAEAVAKKFDSDVRLINVQSLLPIAIIDYVPENFGDEIRLGLEKEIAAIAAKVDRPTERVSTNILYGPVYQKILSEGESWGADAIILSSHRPGMDRFLIGSNASAVVRHATCSVLVVR